MDKAAFSPIENEALRSSLYFSNISPEAPKALLAPRNQEYPAQGQLEPLVSHLRVLEDGLSLDQVKTTTA